MTPIEANRVAGVIKQTVLDESVIDESADLKGLGLPAVLGNSDCHYAGPNLGYAKLISCGHPKLNNNSGNFSWTYCR